MIQKLRSRHRTMATAMAVLGPATLVVALALRPDVAEMESLPPKLKPLAAGTTAASSGGREVWSRPDLWAEQPVHTRLLAAGNAHAIELSRPGGDGGAAPGRGREPTLMLYALPSTAAPATPLPAEGLPPDARHLGALTGAGPARFNLPPAPGRDGVRTFALYDLEAQAIVATARF